MNTKSALANGAPYPSVGVWSNGWDPPGKFEHCLQACTESSGAVLAPGAQEARTGYSAAVAPVGTTCAAISMCTSVSKMSTTMAQTAMA